jgi:hypothetical protein
MRQRLKTHHFGEHWGRHWLDVARYADVSGSTVPTPFPEAWRYRDYVFNAFNSDKAWPDFVREQIAGDLLASDDPVSYREQKIATGFLAIAHVVAADRDPERMKLDTIDEQIDVIGKAFLGVQIGCARCHDHKIDPFPTREYYALAGIFRSTQSTRAEDVAQERLNAPLESIDGDLLTTQPAWLRGGQKAKMHAVRDLESLKHEPIHLRGEPYVLGEVVPRGLPTLVDLSDIDEISESESGRRELAEWIASEQNVLAWRLIVNRVWHHLFGQGLVRSVDNFGLTGDPPSHRELLDHLVLKFQHEHRGSFKSLIRELVNTRAFRQQSIARREALAIDPDNRLLWRANIRRRDAEALIDSIQFAAGTINLEPDTFNVPSFKAGNTGSTSNLDIPTSILRRRALYWPVFRKDVPIGMDFLSIFDFPPSTAPRGNRAPTRVPSQALTLLNSPLVLNAANALVASLSESDEKARLNELFLRALSRLPTKEEFEMSLRFLDDFQRELEPTKPPKSGLQKTPHVVAWNRLAHSLFASNEFLTLE